MTSPTAATPLRIAVWHNLSSGGAKRALYYHVRGLIGRGHHVEAWCPPTADRSYLPLESMILEHVVGLDAIAPRPLRALTRLGLRAPQPRLIKKMDAHCRSVADAVGTNFDVMLATSCQLLAVAPAARHVRVPTVLYLQEPNRALYEALPRLPWLDANRVTRHGIRAQALGELQSIGDYDRVLVNSMFSRESVLAAYGVSGHVTYLGVDAELFRPPLKPARDYLVGVGAFVPEKNIELVLRAVGRVRPTPPPLVWIGDHITSAAYFRSLTELAAELGVDFAPHHSVTDAELVALVGGARAMVYAPRLEPFGLAPLEANACGVPVIAAAEGGVRETIIDGINGLLVEPDPAAMAEAITSLWDRPAHASALGANARAHVAEAWTLGEAVSRLEGQLLSAAFPTGGISQHAEAAP